MFLNGIHSGNRVYISMTVKIHLLPSDGGPSGPIKSIQTTENWVAITGVPSVIFNISIQTGV